MSGITIITSSLNALPLLQCTAHSIINQTFPNWEWIVVDGASSDGTAAWLQEVSVAHPIRYISEPDRGIYDAWNKALPLVRGGWVLFLGAGDRLKAPDTLEICARMLESVSSTYDLAYGAVELVSGIEDQSGRICDQSWEGEEGRWGYGRPATPNHQGIFHRASLFKHGKSFDRTYRIAGDTAFILPELIKNGAFRLSVTVSLMLWGGISSSLHYRFLMLCEILRANRAAGLAWKRVCYQYASFLYHSAELLIFLAIRKASKERSSDSD